LGDDAIVSGSTSGGTQAPYHALSAEDVARALGTDPERGLEPDEARARLARSGPNELSPPRNTPLGIRLIRQVAEPMALLLIIAAAVAGFGLRERLDAGAILAIVVLNAIIGMVEEGKAARALESLRAMETPTAKLIRGGAILVPDSRDVVPGDLLLLSAGDRVPADVRLVSASSLEVDESLLTGESLPVQKHPDRLALPDAGLGDRPCVAHSGTHVVRGAGSAIAYATGPDTEIGGIAAQLARREPPTPLQRELRALTTRLGAIAAAIAALVFGLTLLHMGITPQSIERSFLAAVALAVAAVPEGLATVVTVALALGVRRMAGRGAIVRRLPAVETLGSTTVILTDKTGTLTANSLDLATVAFVGAGPVAPADLAPDLMDQVEEVAILCNDATLEPPSGDPVDLALLEVSGPSRVAALREGSPRLAAVPFDSERRRMTTLHRGTDGNIVLVKGAPEIVLERCRDAIRNDGDRAELDGATRDGLAALAEHLGLRGMRMLALARGDVGNEPLDAAEHDLTLIAMVGLSDPIRPEAQGAVAEAAAAGVRLIMVTGDHPGTATAIADEVGLAGSQVRTGADLHRDGLPTDPLDVRVYARVEPDQKLSLVETLQERGHVVAVTGDGVNDAPALRRADIGVAMGRTGSDVAREAADMVVTDDNLATIVAAVREGRGIYDNIRKVVDYLVAGNLSEISVVVASLLLFPALGVPLLPLQLLWINLLTDGLPAIALGVDPADPAVMGRPPRRRDDRLLHARRIALLSSRGALIASSCVASLAIARFAWDEPWSHARSIMFTVLVTAHLLYAFAVRGDRSPRGLLQNGWLLVAVGVGLALQALIVVLPAARPLFRTASLTLREVALVAVLGIAPVAMMILGTRRPKRP